MQINHWKTWLHRSTSAVLAMLIIVAASFALFPLRAQAQSSGSDFNVQVSPSPLVVTLNPGEQKTATLTVRNLTNHSETLYPAFHNFSVDDAGNVTLQDNPPANLEEWISFKQPVLRLAAGQSAPLTIVYDTPQEVGFSYSLAIVLKRNETKASEVVRLEGGVAVFNLININRLGAIREVSIEKLESTSSMYEFLPATFELTVKNTGNVIAQPSGTLFIQRSYEDNEPIDTLELNPAESYILPGQTRTFTIAWEQGFPRYEQKAVADNAEPESDLVWNWKQVGDLRFGRYVAKAVLIYNDGQRDVPVTHSDSFWVIPWRIIGGTVLVLGLVVMGLLASGWLGFRAAKKVQRKVKVRRHDA